MVANLLAHTKLFAAGIAESGAYNRTLTPFRVSSRGPHLLESQGCVWRHVTVPASPIRSRLPILMIHGKSSNTGTFPLQSERLYPGHSRPGRHRAAGAAAAVDHGYPRARIGAAPVCGNRGGGWTSM